MPSKDNCINGPCTTCKIEHAHVLDLFDLLDKKIDAKEERSQKLLEDHTFAIQSSLDDGRERFNKLEAEDKSIRSWIENRFDIRDDRWQRIKMAIIVNALIIGTAALSSLVTSVIVFTFLRADVQNLKTTITELEEWKEEKIVELQDHSYQLSRCEEHLKGE